MSLRSPKYTTVVSPRSRRIHAVTLSRPTRTLCGKKFSGWAVGTTDVMNCRDCKLSILKDKVEVKR